MWCQTVMFHINWNNNPFTEKVIIGSINPLTHVDFTSSNPLRGLWHSFVPFHYWNHLPSKDHDLWVWALQWYCSPRRDPMRRTENWRNNKYRPIKYQKAVLYQKGWFGVLLTNNRFKTQKTLVHLVWKGIQTLLAPNRTTSVSEDTCRITLWEHLDLWLPVLLTWLYLPIQYTVMD